MANILASDQIQKIPYLSLDDRELDGLYADDENVSITMTENVRLNRKNNFMPTCNNCRDTNFISLKVNTNNVESVTKPFHVTLQFDVGIDTQNLSSITHKPIYSQVALIFGDYYYAFYLVIGVLLILLRKSVIKSNRLKNHVESETKPYSNNQSTVEVQTDDNILTNHRDIINPISISDPCIVAVNKSNVVKNLKNIFADVFHSETSSEALSNELFFQDHEDFKAYQDTFISETNEYELAKDQLPPLGQNNLSGSKEFSDIPVTFEVNPLLTPNKQRNNQVNDRASDNLAIDTASDYTTKPVSQITINDDNSISASPESPAANPMSPNTVISPINFFPSKNSKVFYFLSKKVNRQREDQSESDSDEVDQERRYSVNEKVEYIKKARELEEARLQEIARAEAERKMREAEDARLAAIARAEELKLAKLANKPRRESEHEKKIREKDEARSSAYMYISG